MLSAYLGIGAAALLVAAYFLVKRSGKKEERAEANEDLINVIKEAKDIRESVTNSDDDSQLKRMLKRIKR